METQEDDWGARLAAVVAQEMRRHRGLQNMSAQKLADRCAELGYPVKRSVLANMESGRRDTVTLPELLVISAALGIAPLFLAFPPGAELIEILPDVQTTPWQAMLWSIGESVQDSPVEMTRASEFVGEMHRAHRDLVRSVREALREQGFYDNVANDAELRDAVRVPAHVRSDLRVAVGLLVDLRQSMINVGIVPPALPEDEVKRVVESWDYPPEPTLEPGELEWP